MTVVNRSYLLRAAPIVDMIDHKVSGPGGTSFGMSEAGYDIRIKQGIRFRPGYREGGITVEVFTECLAKRESINNGRFSLASAIEEFNMPYHLMGIVHDKSTWARRGLSVFNTVVEPGFIGGLTLELVYHGEGELIIPAGAGIAQVIFHEIKEPAAYAGKYQFQSTDPVGPIDSV